VFLPRRIAVIQLPRRQPKMVCRTGALRPGPIGSKCLRGSLALGLLRLRDGSELTHRAKQIVLGPLLNHLPAIVKAVDGDPTYL
jgi:hypothetical protein